MFYHIYIIEEASTQKSVQDSVQDNGNPVGVFVGEYEPPFTIMNEILSYVSSISEKIGRITAISSLETKPHLRKNNRIKSIHSSVTCSRHLNLTDFEVGASCSIALQGKAKTGLSLIHI